jgi:hypothetical protein
MPGDDTPPCGCWPQETDDVVDRPTACGLITETG